MPGERFAVPPGSEGARGFGSLTGPGETGGAGIEWSTSGGPDSPFVAGEIADRGPLERTGGAPVPEPRARDARELERQRAWREQASRAITAQRAEEGTGPVNADRLAPPEERAQRSLAADGAEPDAIAGPDLRRDIHPDEEDLEADDELLADRAIAGARAEGLPGLRGDASILPTLRAFPHGISRKRLEQAIKELQLPVIIAREPDEADVVLTLRSEYRQKTPAVRAAEERGVPIYVLKSNTIVQMEASLTSLFALEVDPREAALRETEDAIGLVISRAEPIELSPQNSYIRRLQHQMAERANLVSRSRGREPYRRVRLYPDEARTWR